MLIFLTLLYVGTPDAYSTYNLSSSDLKVTLKNANDHNLSAIEKLIWHYAVNKDKNNFELWKAKKEDLMNINSEKPTPITE